MKSPRHLLECWPRVLRTLRRTSRVVLFLDFDGTLVRLRRRPEDVRLTRARPRLLRRLAGLPRVSIYFISGRGLADLRRLVQVPGAHYLGLHGWERSDEESANFPWRKRLERVRNFVERSIRNLPGVWVQDKRACFGVHYRLASAADAERARAVVTQALERLGPEFRLLAGKKIWELIPLQLGTKGDAARSVLAKIGGRTAVFYFGDDTTDETAFAALRKAITVRVGRFHTTNAAYSLKGPGEVADALSKLAVILKARRPRKGDSRPPKA